LFAIDFSSETSRPLYIKHSPYELPIRVAADETTVYWIDYNTNRLLSLPLPAFRDVEPTLLAEVPAPNALKLLKNKVFWTSNSGVIGWSTVDGSLERRYDVGGHPVEIETDELTLFFTDMSGPPGSTHLVRGLDISTGQVTDIARGQGYLSSLIIDDRSLYWWSAEGLGSVLRKYPLAGGTVADVLELNAPVYAMVRYENGLLAATLPSIDDKSDRASLYVIDLKKRHAHLLSSALRSPLQLLNLPQGLFVADYDLGIQYLKKGGR